MAKRRITAGVTKKHLARAERERIQRTWITVIIVGIAVVVIGLLVAGWADLNIIPVVTVDGESVSTGDFRGRVRLYEAEIINQMTYYGQTDLISDQLANREIIGQNVIDQIVEDILIEREVKRRGLEITEEDVEQNVGETFGYYPLGTPTTIPTSTPNPTDIALDSITPTATEGPSPTPSPTITPGPSPTATTTSTPYPTSTPITEEGYKENYQSTLNVVHDLYGISEKAFRSQYRTMLYRQKLYEAIEAEIPREQEQVYAKHILVDTEDTALLVLRFLEEGRDWDNLAAEFSTDESNKERGGDLGWFPKGTMVSEFEEAAFNANIGDIVGPVETSFGWHIINILDKSFKALNEDTYQSVVETAYSNWLTDAVEAALVETRLNWQEKMPPIPDLEKIFSSS